MRRMQRTMRRTLAVLAAVGLALGVSTGLDAQERQSTTRDQARLNQDRVQAALTNPDQQLRQLKQMSGLKQGHVQVVEIGQIVQDDATIEQWRQQNQQAITKFRTELRDNRTVKKALESSEHAVEDVFALYVSDRGAPGSEQAQRQERSQAAQQQGTVYVVVSGSTSGSTQPGSLR